MNVFDHWALSAAIFVPMIGVVVMMLLPRREEVLIKSVALGTALVTMGVGVYILFQFNYNRTAAHQFQVDRPWIPVIHSRYHIFIDGISLPLLVLSMLI